MSCLHILNKAPGEARFSACLADLAGGDTLLLIENAAVATTDNTVPWPEDVKIHVLADDLEARGLKETATQNGWHCVGYPDFVALTLKTEKVVCW